MTTASVLIPTFKYTPTLVTIKAGVNDLIYFAETAAQQSGAAGQPLVATIAAGTYNYGELCWQVKLALQAAGVAKYTVRYSFSTQKFTLTSDLSGGATLFELYTAPNWRYYKDPNGAGDGSQVFDEILVSAGSFWSAINKGTRSPNVPAATPYGYINHGVVNEESNVTTGTLTIASYQSVSVVTSFIYVPLDTEGATHKHGALLSGTYQYSALASTTGWISYDVTSAFTWTQTNLNAVQIPVLFNGAIGVNSPQLEVSAAYLAIDMGLASGASNANSSVLSFAGNKTGASTYTSDTATPAMSSVVCTQMIRQPQPGRVFDREDLIMEYGASESISFGNIATYSMRIDYESRATVQLIEDMINNVAGAGSVVRLYPDQIDATDYIDVIMTDKDVKYRDMSAQGFYGLYSITFNFRVANPNSGTFAMRDLLDRGPKGATQ